MSTGVRKIVVAVSGGVDSVALLDMLVKGRMLVFSDSEIIVAHLDHGIREDSNKDREFVKDLSKKYGFQFEAEQVHLGEDTSEAMAREVRYDFLRRVCKKHNADTIVTAHHQDDLVETGIANMLRGTGWRGLTALQKTTKYKKQNTNEEYMIVRPLLNKTKSELIQYAKENKIEWREDSTNEDQEYLRNYIRHSLIPQAKKLDADFNKKTLKHIEDMSDVRQKIENELDAITENYRLSTDTYKMSRYLLIMWPENVAHEVIYKILRELDAGWHPEKNHINTALLFVKTAKPGKTLHISKHLSLSVSLREAAFQFTP